MGHVEACGSRDFGGNRHEFRSKDLSVGSNQMIDHPFIGAYRQPLDPTMFRDPSGYKGLKARQAVSLCPARHLPARGRSMRLANRRMTSWTSGSAAARSGRPSSIRSMPRPGAGAPPSRRRPELACHPAESPAQCAAHHQALLGPVIVGRLVPGAFKAHVRVRCHPPARAQRSPTGVRPCACVFRSEDARYVKD